MARADRREDPRAKPTPAARRQREPADPARIELQLLAGLHRRAPGSSSPSAQTAARSPRSDRASRSVIATPCRASSFRIFVSRSPSASQRSITGRCATHCAQPSPRGRPPIGCSASSVSRTSSSVTAAPSARTPAAVAAARYRRTVLGSSPSCAASRFRGRPARHRRSTSLTSTIVTSRYIPPPGLGTGPGQRRCVAWSAVGGMVLKNPAPAGGKGFEKPQVRGGKGFEKLARKGSLGFENRHAPRSAKRDTSRRPWRKRKVPEAHQHRLRRAIKLERPDEHAPLHAPVERLQQEDPDSRGGRLPELLRI